MPRQAGHPAGVEALGRIVEAAPTLGIDTLTVYAFSADNWQRPKTEVGALMALLRRYLDREARRLAESGTRLNVIGRRDRLPAGLATAIARAEATTPAGRMLTCASPSIIPPATPFSPPPRQPSAAAISAAKPSRATCRPIGEGPDVDLLIRTGGEQRLTDFLLWECAYAELYFTDRLWPDFSADDLAAAVALFHGRERRFGGLSRSVSAA